MDEHRGDISVSERDDGGLDERDPEMHNHQQQPGHPKYRSSPARSSKHSSKGHKNSNSNTGAGTSRYPPSSSYPNTTNNNNHRSQSTSNSYPMGPPPRNNAVGPPPPYGGGGPPPHPNHHYGYPGSSYGAPPQQPPPPPPNNHYHHPPHPHHPHPHPHHPHLAHAGHPMHMGHYSVGPGYGGVPTGPPPPPPPPPHSNAMKGTYHPHPHHSHPHPNSHSHPHPNHMSYGPMYGGMPTYPHHPHPGMAQPPMYPAANINHSSSDSMSLSSKGSMNSKKKRTIDGGHPAIPNSSSNNSNNNSSGNTKTTNSNSNSNSHMGGNMPSAYSFRRTDSNSSATSTVTAGNNTSLETNLTEESPHKRDRSDSFLPALNMDGMMFDDHSTSRHSRPNSRQGRGGGSGHPPKPVRYHRRDYSAASTASSLSVGGFSLASYEKATASTGLGDGGSKSAVNHVVKSSPKRHKKTENKINHNHHHTKAPLLIDTSSSSHEPCLDDDLMPHRHQHHHLDNTDQNFLEHLSLGDKIPSSTTSSDSNSTENHSNNLFLSLSTSPINAQPNDIDATPISKNTKRLEPRHTNDTNSSIFVSKVSLKARPQETPTPPVHGELGDGEMLNDDHNTLNTHLRGQSFTPLPHLTNSCDGTGISPSNAAFASSLAPQLSWSIAGDTPSLGDLADWDEDHTSAGVILGTKLKTSSESKLRPGSTTSTDTRNLVLSPHDFQLWKDEHELGGSSLMMMDRTLSSGTTTPLPLFFDNQQPQQPNHQHSSSQHSIRGEGSENQQQMMRQSNNNGSGSINHNHNQYNHQNSSNNHHHHLHDEPQHMLHPVFSSGGSGGNSGNHNSGNKHDHHNSSHPFWSKHSTIGMPPTPMFASSDFRDDPFCARSPMHSERRDSSMDYLPSYSHHPGHHGGNTNNANNNERIRNLRGRVPGNHLPPMPIHIPPHMASHLPMTSPMGLGPKSGMWSPHHGGGGGMGMGSPCHMGSPLMNMAQSKRKCVPLKPPIPSKFQGDMDKVKNAPVPEFTSLVNFPSHMSQKQSVNLPDGMRCCVMCGQACPCSTGNKGKKCTKGNGKPCDGGGLAPRSSNGQDQQMGGNGSDSNSNSGYAIIPTQNKGLCTLCDVNVWVVVNTGLEIKWCKGCKNFRPWAAFGDKGLATKCLRCRERQREKYALQKEEKEKVRVVSKPHK